jgi:ABC-2 type transport system permease protein
MMVALLFLYLYNIRMIPLEGDFRAALLAYLNLGMAGFVIAAICLRFAFPSLSAEGKQFWILESAPISFRRILWTKVAVYLAPLLGVGLLLTVLANLLLGASGPIWAWTLAGSLLSTCGLTAMGVGMGAIAPDFRSENPMEVAVSLGGLAYMALSMLYVGAVMILLARPFHRFLLRIVFGRHGEELAWLAPIAGAIALSLLVAIAPMEIAARRHAASRRS